MFMKILRMIIYFILMLTAIFSAILLYCLANPGVGKALSERLSNASKGGMGTTSLSVSSVSGDPSGSSVSGGAADLPEGFEGVNPSLKSTDISWTDDPTDVAPEYSAKTGYEGVSANDVTVTDREASGIQKTLSPGNTGDDLTFDPLFYPYYEMLDDKNKSLYRQIYANATDLNGSFSPVQTPNIRNLRTAFLAVINDHPELFWLNTSFSSLSAPSGVCVEMDLSFNSTADDLDGSKAKFDSSVSQILTGLRNLSDDPSREEYVHKILIDSITYDRGASMNQSAYSALVNGKTVCAGYSRAFQYLMQQLNVPTYYCAGNAGEPHAWNIIKLEDGYYNVDSTWDDTPGHESDYYNRDDVYFNPTHRRRELSIYLPACNGSMYAGPAPQAPSEEETDDTNDSGASDPEEDHLIQSAYENSLKTLSDYSLSESDLLYDIDSYYKYAGKAISENGIGSFEFDCAVHGKELMEKIRRSNRNGEYKEAYMEETLNAMGAVSCFVKMQIEELQGDDYLIKHAVDIR